MKKSVGDLISLAISQARFLLLHTLFDWLSVFDGDANVVVVAAAAAAASDDDAIQVFKLQLALTGGGDLENGKMMMMSSSRSLSARSMVECEISMEKEKEKSRFGVYIFSVYICARQLAVLVLVVSSPSASLLPNPATETVFFSLNTENAHSFSQCRLTVVVVAANDAAALRLLSRLELQWSL